MELSESARQVKDACEQYDSDVRDGRITFDAEGFAADYPGQIETDSDLAAFVHSKFPESAW